MSDFENIKDRLKDEYKVNAEAIVELNKKIRTLEVNDLGNRGQIAFALGALPWIGAVLATPLFMKTGLSAEIFHLIQAGVPVGIGLVGEKSISKRREIDIRLEEFSDAKTQEELLLERTKYNIEKAYLINLNKILQKVYESIESKETLINSLSDEYDVIKKDTNNVVNRDVKIDKLNKLLEEAKEKIRIAVTQCFLREEFFKYRYRFFGNTDIFIYSMLGFLGGLAIIAGPALCTVRPGVSTSEMVGLEMFLSATGACIGTATYLVRKNKNYTKVFLECNGALGKDKLKETIKHDYERSAEQEYYDRVLEKAISDAVEIRLSLEKEIASKVAEETTKKLESDASSVEKIYGVSITDPVTQEQRISLSVDESPIIDTDKKLKKTYPTSGDDK